MSNWTSFKPYKFILLIQICIWFFTSCDKIEVPLEKRNQPDTLQAEYYDTTYAEYNNNQRITLIEDYTGHTCPNCPAAATEIKRLSNIFPNELIAVAVHTGFFAKPQNNADGSFKTDFRTPEGAIYESAFGIQAFPAGVISRLQEAGTYVASMDDWEVKINTLKNEAAKFKIDITNLYSDSLKLLKINTQIEKLHSENITSKISVYIIESKIIDWQINGSTIVPNYEHNHVLRKVINGAWGEEINFQGSSVAEFNYSSNLLETWNYKNCEVIIFIWDSTTKEVYQVNRAKIGK